MKILVACEESQEVCKDYPHVGIPDSWGTKAHATAYMAALLGLTVDEMRRAGTCKTKT